MILLDIAAPILLMMGLLRASAESAALLGNFEIVATSVIALALFREKISKRLWISIALVTLSSVILSLKPGQTISLSAESLLILARVSAGDWRTTAPKRSSKNTAQIVILKGILFRSWFAHSCAFTGRIVSRLDLLLRGAFIGFRRLRTQHILFMIRAQRDLGAAKTSAYYAIAPFFWAWIFSWILSANN
jgi:drug/metabolite transporter (DMT)-like permease